jgi:putative oxidoreductase
LHFGLETSRQIIGRVTVEHEGAMNDQLELRKYLPSLVWYRPFEPFAFAFIRLSTGMILTMHGAYRVFYNGSAAEFGGLLGQSSASTVGAFELFGGAMIALGLLTRPLALAFAFEWLAIALAVPAKPGTSWFLLSATPHYAAMVTAICVAFVMRGGGHYSLDRLIGKEF